MNDSLEQNWRVLKSAWSMRSVIPAGNAVCDEPAFLPANLAVIQTPGSPLARALLLALCTLVLVAIIWASLGKVDVVVAGQGRTLPRANVQAVSWGGPGEASIGMIGAVRAIRVSDGDHVRKGQILLELDPTLSDAEAGQAREALTSAEVAQARSRALVDYLSSGKLDPHWPAKLPAVQAQAQSQLLMSAVAEYEAKASALRSQEAQAEQSRSAAEVSRAKIAEAQGFVEKELSIKRQLAEKGYVSKVDLYRLEQQRIEHVRDSEAQRSEAMKARSAIGGFQDQLRQLRDEFSKESFSGLVQSGEDANVRRLEIAKAVARNNMLQIRAPLAGTVEQLHVHTLGSAVQAAEQLLTIVPDNSPITVEAQILNRDVGFVHAGQRVDIKVDAFPFAEFGMLHGTLTSLSGTSVAPTSVETDRPAAVLSPSVYLARITLDDASLAIGHCGQPARPLNDCRIFALSPGMTLQAEIKTGRRRIISYLLSPITGTFSEAGRER